MSSLLSSFTSSSPSSSSPPPPSPLPSSLPSHIVSFLPLSTVSFDSFQQFHRERIPERVVHARGTGAFGIFESSGEAENLFVSPLLSPGGHCRVFVRFSNAISDGGNGDTKRDVRGFAVKLYLPDGNTWDVVGNNIPVFPIIGGAAFPSFVHSARPNPMNSMPTQSTAHDEFYDFASLNPQSSHFSLWISSERGTPRSYRQMESFSVNSFVSTGRDGERRLMKFSFLPKEGVRGLLWEESQKLLAIDPDFHRRDLWESIERKCFPKWDFICQSVREGDVTNYDFSLLDTSKILPLEVFPPIRLGTLTLNENVSDGFAQSEQSAFCPSNLLEGLEFSADPMLRLRAMSYKDAQIYRLNGPNYKSLPINGGKGINFIGGVSGITGMTGGTTGVATGGMKETTQKAKAIGTETLGTKESLPPPHETSPGGMKRSIAGGEFKVPQEEKSFGASALPPSPSSCVTQCEVNPSSVDDFLSRNGPHRQKAIGCPFNYFPNSAHRLKSLGERAEEMRNFHVEVAVPSLEDIRLSKGPKFISPPSVSISDPLIAKTEALKYCDFYRHGRVFWNSQSESEKLHIIQSFQFELSHVISTEIRMRMVEILNHTSHHLAKAVAEAIGVPTPPPRSEAEYSNFGNSIPPKCPSLSPSAFNKSRGIQSIAMNRVGILLGESVDTNSFCGPLNALLKLAEKENFVVELIGPHLGTLLCAESSESIKCKRTYWTASSVLFDAVAVFGDVDAIENIRSVGQNFHFLLEAIKHCKPIGAVDEAVILLEEALGPKAIQSKGFQLSQGEEILEFQGITTQRGRAMKPMAKAAGKATETTESKESPSSVLSSPSPSPSSVDYSQWAMKFVESMRVGRFFERKVKCLHA